MLVLSYFKLWTYYGPKKWTYYVLFQSLFLGSTRIGFHA